MVMARRKPIYQGKQGVYLYKGDGYVRYGQSYYPIGNKGYKLGVQRQVVSRKPVQRRRMVQRSFW